MIRKLRRIFIHQIFIIEHVNQIEWSVVNVNRAPPVDLVIRYDTALTYLGFQIKHQ